MTRTVIDIETRSILDLTKVGTAVYAADPTTSITHIGYKNGAATQVWQPAHGPIPNSLADALADERVTLVAHNTSFERLVLGGPPGRAIGVGSSLSGLERWDCTAARAAQAGLPRDLGGAGRALNLPVQKDREGRALMLRVCKPRTKNPLTWWDDPDRMSRMADYCARDVEAESLLDRTLPPLSPTEREIWEATERLNDRGVRIDQTLLDRLIELAERARRDIDARISAKTDKKVPRVSNHGALTRWLIGQGLEIDGTSKDVVEELLENDKLDPAIRTVLELRQAGGGSSSTKAAAIARQLSSDGRIRGALIYGGAPATLRWSSHGAQLHNLPRHDEQFLIRAILRDLADEATLVELEDIHGPPLKLVSQLLRSTLIAAPGTSLVVGDYAQIEARVLAWLSGQDDRLDVFRRFDAKTGPDPYRITAARIYQTSPEEIDPDQRQIGKVADLALGYQGGARAFRSMAKNFGLKIPTKQAEEIKFAWRAAHPRIVAFWRDLESAAYSCIAEPPGEIFPVSDRIRFQRNHRAMTMRLPSGRKLTYWQPSLKEVETPWGELRLQVHYWSQNAVTRQWEEFSAYGGLFAENATQATARDVMADALVRLDQAGFRPVLTVHDEAVCETTAPKSSIERIMNVSPEWTDGLPLAVKVTAASRYQKE